MSPRSPDPEVGRALIDAAAGLLRREGKGALTTRRLAAEVGASTMAVYTYFGGMNGLHRAVRKEGFARLSAHFEAVPATEDPVADLSALGWAYCFNGIVNSNLYRAVFLEPPLDAEDEAVGRAAVQQPIDTVARCIAAGRFRPAEPESLATQLWAASHGMVTGVLARLLTLTEVSEKFSEMGVSLYVGYGDKRDAAQRSVDIARERMSVELGITA
ncbi:MAG: TetR/AcrR family transcriptional regulator [Solirubrobacterales bacterium]